MAEEQKTTKTPVAPASQKFNLKETESRLLLIVHNNQQAVFSAILASIAVDRLGYNITPQTQFKLDDKLSTIEIEEIPEQVPVAKAKTGEKAVEPQTTPAAPPQPPAEPKTGAVAAG